MLRPNPYLEALEAPAALVRLLLLPHGRPDICVHNVRALHCLHSMTDIQKTDTVYTWGRVIASFSCNCAVLTRLLSVPGT